MNDEKQIKASLAAAGGYAEVRELCKMVHFPTLGTSLTRKFLRAFRKFGTDESVRPVRIAYLGNMTFEPLPDYVEVVGHSRGLLARPYIGGYDQYMQELISNVSGLSEFRPDFIVLNLLLRELVPDAVLGFPGMSSEQRKEALCRVLDTVSECVKLAMRKHDATILVSNFPAPPHYHFGIADHKQAYPESLFYAELNAGLHEFVKGEPRIHLLDMERLSALHGKSRAFDEKLYYLAKVPWQEEFYPLVADQIIRHVEAALGLSRKCLVLDLDNTLWGGVLGEVGPHGVKVGHGDGESEAFHDFQRKIVSLKERGIILAACSKNNLADVQELFEQRTDMPLKFSDFSAYEINWDMKHTNLERLAKTLNIGLDSLVFIDDNPAECELIRQMLPQVNTVQLPPDPSAYPAVLDTLHDFEKVAVGRDDREKARQYAENATRHRYQENFNDLESYLESLQTTITIKKGGEEEKLRIHQLFSKTNQFNLTTRRYSLAEIEKYLQDHHHDLYTVQAEDRFGDLGIIGLCLVDNARDDDVFIDSFILSCRAMGRGIESAVMNFLKGKYLQEGGRNCLRAQYIPTNKNKPARNFYPDQGFRVEREASDGETFFTLAAVESSMKDCHWIQVKEQVPA